MNIVVTMTVMGQMLFAGAFMPEQTLTEQQCHSYMDMGNAIATAVIAEEEGIVIRNNDYLEALLKSDEFMDIVEDMDVSVKDVVDELENFDVARVEYETDTHRFVAEFVDGKENLTIEVGCE